MYNSVASNKSLIAVAASASEASAEAKSAIRKKAFDSGDSIDFFIDHSDLEYRQIAKEHVMTAFNFLTKATKSSYGFNWVGTMLMIGLYLFVFTIMASVARDLVFHGKSIVGNYWGPVGLLMIIGGFAFFLSISVVMSFIEFGGANLVSFYSKGHSRNYAKELTFAANTIIGVGANGLYHHGGDDQKVRKINYDAIGEIEGVAYSVPKTSGEGREIQNEISIQDSFGRDGLNMRNFKTDKDVDVLGELKRRRDENQ